MLCPYCSNFVVKFIWWKMNLVVLGAPACGKGTYSEYLSKKYNFVHLSMGELLRQAVANGHKCAEQISSSIANGQIVDEYITANVLNEYLKANNLYDQIILDGYPRGVLSAELLENILKVDAVIRFELDEDEIKNRILNRLRCSDCGKTFSKLFYDKSSCESCGGALIRRNDDNLETLNKRIKVYHEQTLPVFDYYEKSQRVYVIDVNCSIEQGKEKLDKLIAQLKTTKN